MILKVVEYYFVVDSAALVAGAGVRNAGVCAKLVTLNVAAAKT